MSYQMVQIPVTLSEVEGHFCNYDCQSVLLGPSEFAELLVIHST